MVLLKRSLYILFATSWSVTGSCSWRQDKQISSPVNTSRSEYSANKWQSYGCAISY